MDNFRVDLHRARGTALGCPTGRMRRPARREWGCTTTSVTSSLAFQWHPWDPLLDMSKEEHLWKMHKKNGWVGLECSPKYTTITNHVLGDVFFSSGMNIHKSPAIWGSGDARFPGLRRPHRKSQVDRGATLGAKMCFDDLWWRIGSKNWEPYFSGLWDIGWILGLNFLSFFLMVWFLAFFGCFQASLMHFPGNQRWYCRVIISSGIASGELQWLQGWEAASSACLCCKSLSLSAPNKVGHELPSSHLYRAEIDVHQPDITDPYNSLYRNPSPKNYGLIYIHIYTYSKSLWCITNI